ncbi:polyprotein of EF-Ts, chloroplastic-like [Zingiber officinale]|uniref:polyprotein of EF-Ts, chloroplastic-like n=1 Tax=Zingiber officinale TaxID=94328 RepID=UPI001C4B648D|nr:polyprotein of EF-Ts, chloroplastic-like [Zingiber officinale]
MTPVIHCSVGNITLVPRTVLPPRKEVKLTRCDTSGKDTKLKSYRRFLLSHSSVRLFQLYRSSGIQTMAAVGTDLTVEETNPTVSAEVVDETLEVPPSSDESSVPSPSKSTTISNQTKRIRPGRKSEMPPVNEEELVPGASFIGKIRSIQPFGCFVDFGAYTDGLVHVSRISDSYVKDVASVVSIGQEVKVRIVEANKETGRISLTMRDKDGTTKVQQKRESTAESGEKPKSFRKTGSRSDQKRGETKKSSKFAKGQILDGTVKNLIRSGAFISLPDGEEGFLPIEEESDSFVILGSSSLQVGQEVNVRVLRIARGKVTLTMKKEEDVDELNKQLNQGVVHTATNPFELAFRKNKEISAFLDERKRTQESLKKIEQTIEVGETVDNSDAFAVDNSAKANGDQTVGSSDSHTEVNDEISINEEQLEEIPIVDSLSDVVESKDEGSLSALTETVDTVGKEDEKGSELLSHSSQDSVIDEIPVKGIEDSTEILKEESITSQDSVPDGGESFASNLSFSLAVDDTLPSESKEAADDIRALEQPEGTLLAAEEAEASSTQVTETGRAAETDEASLPSDDKEAAGDIKSEVSVEQVTETETFVKEEQGSEVPSLKEKEGNLNSTQVDDSAGNVKSEASLEQVTETEMTETPAKDEQGSETDDSTGQLNTKKYYRTIPEDLSKNQFDKPIAIEDVAVPTNSSDAKSEAEGSLNEQTDSSDEPRSVKATISPALVKQLREETGAGMMDCKKALVESGGDIAKAQELLRKKGLASADKKASRTTAEGRIGSYIHDSRIGILIEVNCETDFVSRGEIFKELVEDLAMQVAACSQVCYLATEDIPEDIVNKEREIEMQKEDLLSKPENIRSKIVDGRIRKRLEEFVLLEQPYIKNDKMVVKDLVKQTIATIGENIKVKRFVRLNLGEGLEKKSQNFAAEIAAQTTAKSSPAVAKDQSTETKDVEKSKTVAVSASLVKQLREETGAGMMDCKKALAETEGDIEKAQEYLRKKGLASADKKSSRLAAEGRISAYIHDARIGTLIEVNCETDFVSRNEKFKELVDDLAMQVVACPQVEFVSIDEIPESIIAKEKEIEMARDDLKSKPDQIKEKIVEGRITKRLGELALLEQPFIKDDDIKVKDLVKQTVAALGENIKVRRFVRFTLGEN